MRYATNCRCDDPLVFSEDPQHCFRCGRGPCAMPTTGRAARRRRLPWDLGALQREGRRPDPHLENVVRFEQLTVRPVLRLVEPVEDEAVHLRPAERRCLAYAADGMSNGQIASALGITTGSVSANMSNVYAKLGLGGMGAGPASGPARDRAIEWWQDLHTGELAA